MKVGPIQGPQKNSRGPRAQGLLEKIEDHPLAVGGCYRCKTVVEPYMSMQWYVKVGPLAEPAIEAVRRTAGP